MKRVIKQKNEQKLSHNELIRRLSENPADEAGWREFERRFHEYIMLVVNRKRRQLPYIKDMCSCEDLVQEVYAKLLRNDCKALRAYEGKYERSAFTYLAIIATRVVLSTYDRYSSQARMPEGGKTSLDATIFNKFEDRISELKDMISSEETSNEIGLNEMKDELMYHVNEILKRTRHRERDLLIFQYYFFGGLEPNAIAELPEIGLSYQRVMNIINDLRKELGNRFGRAA